MEWKERNVRFLDEILPEGEPERMEFNPNLGTLAMQSR